MRLRMTIAVAGVLMLLTLGCSDNTISYPIGDGGWQIGITLAGFPPRVDDLPVFISIQIDVVNLTDGQRPGDGSIVVVTSSGGSFVNGLAEIELGTLNGRVVTELEISRPGTYEVTAEYPQEACTTAVEFSIGLE